MEQYSAEWQAWHDARISDLATPFGWLSVTGLTWLTSSHRHRQVGISKQELSEGSAKATFAFRTQNRSL